jgi:hypothetical protein
MMNLTESVAKLETLIPKLKANDAKFASDLIRSFKKYGSLTVKQTPWIEKLIVRAEAPVFSAPLAAPAAVNVGGFAGVVALFAKVTVLKFPKIRLMVEGTKVVLSLNGAKSKNPGFISISGEGKYPNRTFYGRVSPEGTFTPAHAAYGSFLTALTSLLTELASNPVRVAKDHGKLTGHCCFCGKSVGYGKEDRSALVGFGPDCAERWGFKTEWLAAAEKAEAQASVAPVTPEAFETWTTAVKAEVDALSTVPVKETEDKLLAELIFGAPAVDMTTSPTLTVTPAAHATINELAESLAKATGAVAVTVTDGPLTASYGPNPGDVGDLEPVESKLMEDFLAPNTDWVDDGSETVKAACIFCEVASEEVKMLHGHAVCPECVKELVS